MIRIGINLSSKPFVNKRRFFLITSSLLILLAGVSYWNVSRYKTFRALHKELNRLVSQNQAQIDQLRTEEQQIANRLQTPETAEFLDVVDHVNLLINRRTFSWTRLLNDLETLIPSNVQIVSIRPQIVDKEFRIEITANARNSQDYIDFISNLESSKKFHSVNPMYEEPSKAPNFVGKLVAIAVKYNGQA